MRGILRRALLALALLPWLFAAPAAAEWRRGESANFVVYSNGSERKLRESILLLEDFDRLLRTITTVSAPPTPNKLHVYLVPNGAALRRVRAVSPSIAGFYSASGEGIAALVDREAEAGGNHVLFHEYAHHFMMQYAANAYPAWYVEGFAEYVATADFTRRHIDIGKFSPGRAWSLTDGQWLPIERVLFGEPDGLGSDAMAAYYAQSWLIAHWFNSTPERLQALRRYLTLARGGDARAALEEATGLTPDALHEELRRYVRRGSIVYRRMAREAEAPPAIAVTALPPAADDLILEEAALRIGIRDDAAEEALARIRAAAARHPGDAYAERVLALAEILHGDPAAAAPLLDRLTAAAGDDPELMYLRGRYHLVRADAGDGAEIEAAKEWFGRAFAADDNHWQTLYRYALTMRSGGEYLSENTSNILLLASQLAPQVAEIRLNAAAQLIARRKRGDAEALLRPLVADPHNPDLAEAAARLLRDARSAGEADHEDEDEDELQPAE